jgi:hypothetical protein
MTALQREFEVLLPIGYNAEDGQAHRRAWIRKMRGHEEALLYDASLGAGRLVTELIRGCLIRLGSIEPVGAEVVSRLFSADRNYLMVEIRRATLGDRLPAAYPCPSCGTAIRTVEDLSTLPVRRLAEGEALGEITVELEDGSVDREGTVHTTVVLGLPRGEDEDFVAPMLERDPLKARDSLLLRCIRRFGTLPRAALEAYGVRLLRDLTLGDRRRIQHALSAGAPGVDLLRTLACVACGTRSEHLLDVSDFLSAG